MFQVLFLENVILRYNDFRSDRSCSADSVLRYSSILFIVVFTSFFTILEIFEKLFFGLGMVSVITDLGYIHPTTPAAHLPHVTIIAKTLEFRI